MRTPGSDFSWDPSTRRAIARVRSTAHTSMPTREDAARKLRHAIATGPLDVVVVCEGTGLDSTKIMPFWTGFLRLARARVRIALVGFPEDQRGFLEAWAVANRFECRACASEAQAAAWLDAPPAAGDNAWDLEPPAV